MRPLALVLLLTLCVGIVRAQEQESKLVARLLHPDTSLGNWMQNMSYNASGGGLDTTKSATVKQFDFIQKFSPKSFDTKAFDTKDYWAGDFKFSTKAADVKTYADTGKSYGTKAAIVKDATESDKSYETKDYATREAVEKGKTSQNHLNETFLGKPQMNMDEVRDLLNKSRKISPTEVSGPPQAQ
jgi:hypothetical protein